METSSISQNDIILAWAMPISLSQLGARLETYATTKAAITTFQIAARKRMLAIPHTLPEEIIGMIASKVRDVDFKPKMKLWAQINRCLANKCNPLSHLSIDYSMFSSNVSERSLLKHGGYEEAAEVHQKRVKWYCKMLSNLDGKSSKFAKCVRVFTQDFGLRPYFLTHKSYQCDYGDGVAFGIDSVQAKAFLTLPLVLGPIKCDPGPQRASISVCKTIPLAALVDERVQMFKVALNVLGLRPCGLDEVESFEEDESKGKVRMPECSDEVSDETGSEDSDDHNHDDGENCSSQTAQTDKSDNKVSRDEEAVGKVDVDMNAEAGRQKDLAENKADGDGGCSSGPKLEEHAENRTSNADGTPEKKEVWPQLMMLGCGEFTALETPYY